MARLPLGIRLLHMACTQYEKLIQIWRLFVHEQSIDGAVDAYWGAVEHRLLCEVCRDEAMLEGCFGMYLMLASSVINAKGRRRGLDAIEGRWI